MERGQGAWAGNWTQPGAHPFIFTAERTGGWDALGGVSPWQPPVKGAGSQNFGARQRQGPTQEGEHNVEHGAWATTTDTEGSCKGITSTMDAAGGLTRQWMPPGSKAPTAGKHDDEVTNGQGQARAARTTLRGRCVDHSRKTGTHAEDDTPKRGNVRPSPSGAILDRADNGPLGRQSKHEGS